MGDAVSHMTAWWPRNLDRYRCCFNKRSSLELTKIKGSGVSVVFFTQGLWVVWTLRGSLEPIPAVPITANRTVISRCVL